jgi:prophage regulatory protein
MNDRGIVMSEKSFKTDRLLRIKDLENKLGVKKSTIYKMIQTGEFPKPVKISERARGWRESQAEAWIASRRAA